MILKKQELLKIEGGAISAALLNGIIKGFEGLFNLGRSLGTSLRRLMTKRSC